MLALSAAAALAQDEACPPYPTDRWRAELAAATTAYAAMQIDRAAGIVDELHRQARCLDAPVLPADLGTFARLSAVRWMYDQDPEGIGSWASLAAHVDPDGDWPVAADHPIRRMALAEVRDGAVEGPEGHGVVHPKRGGVFVDGAFLVEPRVRVGEPHLVQLFDEDGIRSGGWWQDGAAFREELVTDVPVPAEPPRWWTGAADEEEVPAGFSAARKDTVAGYRRYLERSPTGEHAAWARRRLDDLEWTAAAEAGTPEAARAYLAEWPDGRNREAADRVLEGEAYRAAVEQGTAPALELFRSRHPRGAYAAEASRRLDDLAWGAAVAEGTAKACANYRLRWPRGVHAREARLAQEDLEWQAAAADGSERALRAHLAAWPGGNHDGEAQVMLLGARFWQVVVGAELAKGVPAAVAAPIEDALAAEVARQGLAVVRVPRGEAPPPLAPGTALLWARVTGVGEGAGSLDAALELRVPGLPRPIAEATTAVSADRADPQVGAQLAERLAEVVPALNRWSRPPP